MSATRRDIHAAVADARQITVDVAATAEQASDWDEAVAAWTVVLRHGAFGRLASETRAALFDLAASCAIRRAWLGGPDAAADTRTAVAWYSDALASADPASPLRPNYANNLGVALRDLSELGDEPAALQESVDVLRLAAATTSPDAPARVTVLRQLATSLRARFALRHEPDDLLAAVAALRAAVSAADAGDSALRAECHGALGNALVDRYPIGKDRGDLDEAIVHLTTALELLDPADTDRLGSINDLASARLARFDVSGAPTDLAQAISVLEEVVRDSAGYGAPSATLLANLGNALSKRSAVSADLEDGDRAVGYLRRAVEQAAATTRLPAMLGNLAAALLERFDVTGQIADVDEAIDVLDDAIARTASEGPDLAARLNNLAIALRRRQLRRRGGREDLDRAVTALERARSVTPPADPDEVALVANLGIALHQRFDVAGDPADLDRAVDALGDAVDRTPRGSPDRPMYLNNLAATLAARAAQRDDLVDLRRASALGREALDASTSAVYRIGALVNLGNALSELFDRCHAPADRTAARRAYRAAVRDGRLINSADALSGARNWSEWAAGRRAWREVVDAHRYGEQAAHRLIEAQSLRRDQESWLRDADGLAALGALAHATRGQLDEAVLAVERGRAVIATELLELGRADLTALGAHRDDLQRRYIAAFAEIRRLQATT